LQGGAAVDKLTVPFGLPDGGRGFAEGDVRGREGHDIQLDAGFTKAVLPYVLSARDKPENY
jgi:hypothetical protein